MGRATGIRPVDGCEHRGGRACGHLNEGCPDQARGVGSALPTLRFHDLRHFYASDLLRDPHLSVKDVSSRMGHEDPTLMLRTYGHLFADSGPVLADRRATARAKAKAANSFSWADNHQEPCLERRGS